MHWVHNVSTKRCKHERHACSSQLHKHLLLQLASRSKASVWMRDHTCAVAGPLRLLRAAAPIARSPGAPAVAPTAAVVVLAGSWLEAKGCAAVGNTAGRGTVRVRPSPGAAAAALQPAFCCLCRHQDSRCWARRGLCRCSHILLGGGRTWGCCARDRFGHKC